MTTKDEALRMALKKAFDLGKRYWSWADSEYSSHWKKADVAKEQFDQLIDDTIREVLAQPEQEPVAWRFRSGTWFNREVHWRYIDTLEGSEGLLGLQPLYITPPQRTWQGLTNEEWEMTHWSPDFRAGAKWAETKLKEKNT